MGYVAIVFGRPESVLIWLDVVDVVEHDDP